MAGIQKSIGHWLNTVAERLVAARQAVQKGCPPSLVNHIPRGYEETWEAIEAITHVVSMLADEVGMGEPPEPPKPAPSWRDVNGWVDALTHLEGEIAKLEGSGAVVQLASSLRARMQTGKP